MIHVVEFAVYAPIMVAFGFVALCLTARRPSVGRHWA